MFGEGYRRRGRVKKMIRIHAVDDIDVMAFICQGVRQPVQLHGVSAEAVGRIESGQMKKIERPPHRWAPVPITSIICRAA
jgi:hypothetical protein